MAGSSPIIDSAYHAAIDRLTPAERVARGLAMLQWTRRWLGRQIEAVHGPIPSDRLKFEIARRLYQSEPATCRLIDAAIAESSTHVSA